MAEELVVSKTMDKAEKYQSLIPQIKALMEGEDDLIANLSNLSAALKQIFQFFWVGFYLNKNNQLVLGPFQGPVACTRIPFGKGVCGTAFQRKETIIVPDVEQFPGHIACSSLSKSEIVVPLVINDFVVLVLDVDSDKFNEFDETDKKFLNIILQELIKHF